MVGVLTLPCWPRSLISKKRPARLMPGRRSSSKSYTSKDDITMEMAAEALKIEKGRLDRSTQTRIG